MVVSASGRAVLAWPGMDDASHLVSDAERDDMVVALRGHLMAGRLTLDEFSERVALAYGARSRQDLLQARSNLPDARSAPIPSRRKAARCTAAVFGRVARRGRLRLRRWTVALGAFSDLDLDLREAEMDRPVTAMTALMAFSNIDVYVPEGINVDVAGLTIFGHHREWGRDIGRPDAPTIRVRALGCFSTVDVWRVPHDMRGSYREIFRQLERQQRQLPS